MEMIDKLNSVSKECLGVPGNTPQQQGNAQLPWQKKLQLPLEQLAASASSNQDILQTLTKIQAAGEDKSSKSFKKIPVKYQKMILLASSVNEAIPTELNPDALEFFKSANTLHATVMLNSHLEAKQIECSILNAMATNLLYGSFLWVNLVTLSGLACSVITTEDFLRNDTLYDGLVLDYSTKFEMSAASLEKLTKTQV